MPPISSDLELINGNFILHNIQLSTSFDLPTTHFTIHVLAA